uniref:DUF6064 family protein n=1 Tax=Thalassobaculum sp. OXR-137 TaxID=3100173 RepID=UPI002AC9D15F|nr:DUF6064 family protein [Thalassobaculum sp. OXR-137]WPZ35080.1 DUF6064 family protein [Thalassobaculum sp. OXR-137]
METWLTYSPQDFLLFSERVYWRLFELHNAALWPAQVPAVLAGLAVPVLLVRRFGLSGPVLAAILALAWAVVGMTFLPRYGEINWLAADLIPVFLAQAALLAVLGIPTRSLEARPGRERRWVGLALCLYGLVGLPLTALVGGRGVAGVEIFALTPDPTAIVTLGALVAAGRGWRALALAIVPALWCAASWATLATLGVVQAWAFLPVALGLGIAAWAARTDGRAADHSGAD